MEIVLLQKMISFYFFTFKGRVTRCIPRLFWKFLCRRFFGSAFECKAESRTFLQILRIINENRGLSSEKPSRWSAYLKVIRISSFIPVLFLSGPFFNLRIANIVVSFILSSIKYFVLHD